MRESVASAQLRAAVLAAGGHVERLTVTAAAWPDHMWTFREQAGRALVAGVEVKVVPRDTVKPKFRKGQLPKLADLARHGWITGVVCRVDADASWVLWRPPARDVADWILTMDRSAWLVTPELRTTNPALVVRVLQDWLLSPRSPAR